MRHRRAPSRSDPPPDDRSLLRLCDGTRLEMADTMLLWAQCHGPNGRDALRSTHPDRQSCSQCHVNQVELSQAPLSLEHGTWAPQP